MYIYIKSTMNTQKQCVYIFTLDKAFHDQLVNWTATGRSEHGGNTRIDVVNDSATVSMKRHTVGSFSSVDLPRGLIDWHTHPMTCKSQFNCTMGLPSPEDMMHIILGSAVGNLAHLVYSSDGVYIIKVKDELRRVMNKSKSERIAAVVKQQFERLFTEISNLIDIYPYGITRRIYNVWQDEWFEIANSHFEVLYYDNHVQIPSFPVNANCVV